MSRGRSRWCRGVASSTALLPRLLRAYGVSCRAGNPRRLRFAGPQVLSLLKVHLASPRAPGPATGSEPWTTCGEARFAKWTSTASAGVGGGLGPGGEGPTRRPCSQPHLGPVHPMCRPHSMTSSNLCPARDGQEVWQQRERAERLRQGPQRAASHPRPQPQSLYWPPVTGALEAPGWSARSIRIAPNPSPAAALPAGHLPPSCSAAALSSPLPGSCLGASALLFSLRSFLPLCFLLL